ncbi:hypothetical protein PMIN03_003910 [Paraphaeosphaeria minitans]
MVSRTLRNLFHYSLPLQRSEYRIAQPAWKMVNKKRTVRLFLDWDGTLTKKDTLHLVTAIGYDCNRDAKLTPWDDIVQAYISDYKQHTESYSPAAEERDAEDGAARRESNWLASLKPVETRSIERVQTADIFRGVIKQDVESAARLAVQKHKLQLRPGWRKLLMHHQNSATAPSVSIISVNWSATFIQACVEAAFQFSASGMESMMVAPIPVYANELPLVEGGSDSCISTSTDKLKKLRQVREDDDVIVDDPMGSSQQELKETLDRLGFETLRLNFDAYKKFGQYVLGRADDGNNRKRIIWWVEDLDEISKFIEEIHGHV